MTNPRTVAAWEALGFRIVEAREIDKYPRIKFEPPPQPRSQPARPRAARVRHRVPNDGSVKYRRAILMADLRAARYCRKIKDSA
jgi:hypothetical protein